MTKMVPWEKSTRPTIMSKCPVCQSRLEDEGSDYLDGHTLCEKYERCPNDCIWEGFSYGVYESRIGPLEWGWMWTESALDGHNRILQQREAIDAMRNHQRDLPRFPPETTAELADWCEENNYLKLAEMLR